MSLVCSWKDVPYGMYDIAGLFSNASEYGCNLYSNAIEKSSSTSTSCEETFSVY